VERRRDEEPKGAASQTGFVGGFSSDRHADRLQQWSL
jgi:hypothetical protein